VISDPDPGRLKFQILTDSDPQHCKVENNKSGFSFDSYRYELSLGKPWKFGILYRSLNDSEVPYTYRVFACAGKPEGEPTDDYVRHGTIIINPSSIFWCFGRGLCLTYGEGGRE